MTVNTDDKDIQGKILMLWGNEVWNYIKQTRKKRKLLIRESNHWF